MPQSNQNPWELGWTPDQYDPQGATSGGWGGGGGGGGGPAGWNNQNSQMYNWRMNFSPDAASWVGNAPNRQGQTHSYNPMTGESSWVNSTEGLSMSGGQDIWYIDPVTGMKTINPRAMQSLMGMGGGSSGQGGYQSFTPSQYSGGGVTPGGGYEGFDYGSIGSGIDPSAVIAAQEPRLQEAMQADFSKAGGRMGQSGFAMSTPYANSLGDASRKASSDRNAITLQYQYDAAQAQAARDLAQQQQAAQLDFGGWQTGYQGDLQSQMFNQGQNFDSWLANNQFGMQNNQGMNDYNMQQNAINAQSQNSQQALWASIMGGMF